MAFIAFAILILFMVFKAVSTDVDLVTENYYENELDYPEKQSRRTNGDEVEESFSIKQSEDSLVILFPVDHDDISGEIKFYRPSDDNLDTIIPIEIRSKNRMYIPLGRFKEGLWHIFVNWDSDGTGYLIEDSIIL